MSRVRIGLLLLAVVAGVVTATPAAAQQRATGSLRLASQTAWVGQSGSFDLHLALDDLTAADRLEVAITIHSRIRSRSAFAQTIDGRPRGTVRSYPAIALGLLAVDADGNRVAGLQVPTPGAPPGPFTLPANLGPGVYPVTVALREHGGGSVDSFVTHLVRLPTDPDLTPLAVAWVQPIGARPALRPDGTHALAGSDAAAVQRSIRAVTGHPEVPMTLDVTPETVAALDPEALAPLRDAVAGDQLLASTYVDVDPSALADAGVADDLAVQRQVGEDALFAALGDRGDPRSWAAARPLTTDAIARLRSLGVTRVVVPESSLAPLDPDVTGARTLTRPFAIAAGSDDTVEGVSVDPGLLEHFRRRGDRVLAAHQLLADLAVLFFDLPGSSRGVVVRPPAGWVPDGEFLDVVLGGLGSASILRPVALGTLFDEVDPLTSDGVPVVRTVADDVRPSNLPAGRLADAHRAFDQLVNVVGPSAALVPGVRSRLLVAEGTRLSTREREALLASVVGERDAVRDGLELPNQRTFRLTAREGTIPVSVVNRNDFPVRVQLVLSSDKLEFTGVHGGDRSRQVLGDLVLQPGTRTFTIPVLARASGTFNFRVTMLTPDGAELRRSRLTIRSTVFSGVGIILSIGAGLFLLLWWAKHWRTSHRATDLVEASS